MEAVKQDPLVPWLALTRPCLAFFDFKAPSPNSWARCRVGILFSWTTIASALSAPQPPVVSITTPTNGSAFTAPANVAITADASDPDGSISSVSFYAGTNLLRTVSTMPFSVVWSNAPWGNPTVTAVATDNQSLRTTSAPVNVEIEATTISVISAGETKLGQFSLAGQMDRYDFTGTTGEVVNLQIEDSLGNYPKMSLYRPDGSFFTNSSGISYYATIWNLRLDQSGTYTLVCQDQTSSGTNQYALTLVKVVGENPGQEDAGTLTAGETRMASLTFGDIDVFRFTGTTGEVIILQLENTQFGTYPSLFLYGPDGSLVTNGVNYYSGASIWAQRLYETGPYTLICTDGTPPGFTNDYHLTLVKVVGDNPSDEDGATLTAGQIRQSTFTLGDIDVYRFTGQTGAVVSLQLVSSGAFTYAAMYLYGPTGEIVTSASAASGFQRAVTLQGVRLPENGIYTLVCFDSTTAGTNQYSLTLMFAPTILTNPVSTNAIVGSTVAFSVIATGAPPPFYQWRKNGVNIPGATNATLTLTNVQVADGGSYNVVVANLFDAVNSEPVDLVVQVQSQAPPQDNFVNRLSLTNAGGFAAGTNLHATREVCEPLHAGKFGTNSVWYTWRATDTGIATFRTVGSTFDTLLAIYTGMSVSNLTLVASDEDRAGFLTSEVQFNAVKDVDYQIAIDGFVGQQGAFTLGWNLEVTNATLPVITAGPTSQSVTFGSTVAFSVMASGSGLTYQWFFNGAPISGATSSALDLVNVQSNHVGFYTVSVVTVPDAE